MVSEQVLELTLPGELTAEDRAAAREAAILKLWERGKISTRAAASSLGLRYHEFLDHLDEEGIAAVQADDLHHSAIQEFLRQSGAESPPV